MEVVVTTGAISHAKLQSNHHHQQTNIQFYTGRMPFLSLNQLSKHCLHHYCFDKIQTEDIPVPPYPDCPGKWALPFLFFTQDVELKISILEWFATCVETQPGVVEVLLNIDSIHNAASGQKVWLCFYPQFFEPKRHYTIPRGTPQCLCVFICAFDLCVCVPILCFPEQFSHLPYSSWH